MIDSPENIFARSMSTTTVDRSAELAFADAAELIPSDGAVSIGMVLRDWCTGQIFPDFSCKDCYAFAR